jgi:hypothetical protein
MKTKIQLHFIILALGLAAVALCLNSCEGLALSMTPDGKVSATYTVPVTEVKSGK